MWEWDALFNIVDSAYQTTVDFTQVTTLLHGNDTHMIFFIAPDQECFVVIVIDTTSSWPETAVHTRNNKKEERVNKQNILSNQFLNSSQIDLVLLANI